MSRPSRGEGKYGYLDAVVLELLQERGPLKTVVIMQELGISEKTWRYVRERLTNKRAIRLMPASGWDVRRPPALKDTSPFPRPSYQTPNVGLWG